MWHNCSEAMKGFVSPMGYDSANNYKGLVLESLRIQSTEIYQVQSPQAVFHSRAVYVVYNILINFEKILFCMISDMYLHKGFSTKQLSS